MADTSLANSTNANVMLTSIATINAWCHKLPHNKLRVAPDLCVEGVIKS